MKEQNIITVSEDEIKNILAEKYDVARDDIHLIHENHEITSLSGHALPVTRYMVKIKKGGSLETNAQHG
ncbi:hypothetical protein IKD60_02410 [Candidatus Saccharibacteria bacterium]|nr:hypothetical protein [Candidatus Saccharibacteria bacterium]